MRANALLIRTPEGIVFSQLLAGPVTRFLAWVVDVACIGVAMSVLGIFIRLLSVADAGLSVAVYTVAYFLVSIGYGTACEWWWRGQTVGKRLFRLRVVDAEGLRVQFNQIITRNLLRFVDLLPVMYFVGGVVCWLSPRCQRLGDLAGNTVVIRAPQLAEPDLDQLLAGKFNSLRQFPHLAARLRQKVTPAEAAIAAQALLRRDEFDPVARVELFALLAEHFRESARFPAEATDGLTDERYVRNVVDVLYRSRADQAKPVPAPAG